MRTTDLFNQMSPGMRRAEAACTYRLFRMLQTHKSVSHLIELMIDLFETGTLVGLLGVLAKATGGVSQSKSNVPHWERRRFHRNFSFLLILDCVATVAVR